MQPPGARLVAEGGGAGANALLAQRVVREVEVPQACLAQGGRQNAQRCQRLILCRGGNNKPPQCTG